MRAYFVSTIVVGLVAGASSIGAQSGPHRAAIAIGGLAFQGTRGESGVGLRIAGRLPLAGDSTRQFALELGLQTLTPFGQICTLGIPGSCNPESPASPMGHARVFVRSRATRSSLLYVGGGVGVYGPVGRVDQHSSVALGLDAVLGVQLSRRVSVEAGYVNLRASHFLGWALPLSIVVRF